MPRSLGPERQDELDSLYALTRALAEFHRDGGSNALATQVVDIVERTHRERSLSGMQQICDELLAATEATLRDPESARRLDSLLRERTRHGLAHHFAAHHAEIDTIRERGFITTDRQYYLLKERLELIVTDPEYRDEAAALQGLLANYEAVASLRHRR
jgi:hypothetical protein